MVNPAELRIGNWLHLKNSDHIKVDSDNIGDVVNNPAIFDPIPLSPAIIEACGFERRDSEVLFLSISVLTNSGLWYSGADMYIHQFGSAGIILPCEYIHQLQNIYFALTGQEIEINIKQTI